MSFLTKLEIAEYLKFGFINTIDTSKTLKSLKIFNNSDISFEEAKKNFNILLKKSILNIEKKDTTFILSGGLDSSALISYVYMDEPSTMCSKIIGKYDAMYSIKLATYFNLNHTILQDKINNIEEYLIQINKLWDKPHCDLGDIFVYHTYKYISQFSSSVVGGEGSEFLLCGFKKYNPLIKLAIDKGEYDVSLAQRILSKSLYIEPNREKLFSYKPYFKENGQYYLDLYLSSIIVFNDKQIEELGYIAPTFDIEDNTLNGTLKYIYSWHMSNMVTNRCDIFGNFFGLKNETPFLDQKLIDFSFSLPNEYKNTLGSTRHILRETVGNNLPKFILNRSKEGFEPKEEWFNQNKEQINLIINKYLSSPKMRIYEYLDFKLVGNYISNQKSYFDWKYIWMFLNLSIWLELQ